MLKDDYIIRATLAAQADRYQDVIPLLKTVIENLEAGESLSIDERNLLLESYKCLITARRNSWRAIVDLLGRLINTNQLKIAEDFKVTIENEIHSICNEVTELLDKYLIKKSKAEYAKDPRNSASLENFIFFLKMKGDYFRYIAELKVDDSSILEDSNVTKAREAYSEGFELCKHISIVNPIRLGLILNFSVFNYEICRKKGIACKMAKAAFEEGISKIEHLEDNNYKDSTLVLQLLRDNLILWSAEEEHEDNS